MPFLYIVVNPLTHTHILFFFNPSNTHTHTAGPLEEQTAWSTEGLCHWPAHEGQVQVWWPSRSPPLHYGGRRWRLRLHERWVEGPGVNVHLSRDVLTLVGVDHHSVHNYIVITVQPLRPRNYIVITMQPLRPNYYKLCWIATTSRTFWAHHHCVSAHGVWLLLSKLLGKVCTAL